MIPQGFIEEIQEKTDIVDLISSYIPLKRAGRNFKALCPFHNEKTPSFFVSPQRQIFHCFGCGQGGGVLQFLMLYERMSFIESVEFLARRLGISIPYQKVSSKDRLKIILYDVVKEACSFFHNNLISLPSAKEALDYLNSRGINKEIVDMFSIGYAPLGNRLIGYMRKRGVTIDILEKASLVVSKQNGSYVDLFRDRIIFPIYDVRKRPVGFGARIIKDKKDVPKYINSFENILYSKREHLFGLSLSKEEIVNKNSVIVTEGYLDMITPFACGIKNIVASLGTALTIEQIRIIKRYTNNIILVFDSDKAGEKATLKAVDSLIEEGMKAEIAQIPKGLDLDLAIREKGVKFVLSLLEKRIDFFDYKVDIFRNLYDIESIEGKVKIAEELLGTISKLTSEVEKYEYIKKLSQILKVKETVLLSEIRKIDKNIRREGAFFAKRIETIPLVEKIVIKSMFSNKKVSYALKDKLNAGDFSHPLAKKTFTLFMEKVKEQPSFTYRDLLGIINDKEISSFLSEIMMDDGVKIDKNLLKDCVAKLRRNRLKTIREEIKQQIRQAESLHDTARVRELMARFNKINSEVRNG